VHVADGCRGGSGAFSEAQAARYLSQVMEGLRYMKDMGVAHRSVSVHGGS
jgi:serine/threonine protein kinase